VDVWGLNIDLQKKMGSNDLRYGFDSQLNYLSSTAYRENVATGAIASLDTRYPDGDNRLNYYALYATHTMTINDKWILNDGIRFGCSSLQATFKDKSFFPFPYDDIKQNNSYASGNLGIIFNPTSWKFSLIGSSGYRVPNIDDLAKVFESVVGSPTTIGTLLVPNPDLKPEKTINMDLGVTKFFGDKARIEIVGFVTQYFDAIAVRPSTFNGQSTIDYQGYPATIMSSQNVDQAYIYGWNALTSIDLIKQLSITAAYNFTYGRAKVDGGLDAPLDHIPPQFGRVSIAYHTMKFRAELFSNFNGKKYLSNYSSSGEDNLQYAPTTGMPSWYTINMRLSYDAGKFFTLQAGVDNIMDLQYRQFASGINSSGRNFFGTLRAKF
jgi:hemoglobin/transferrin/lactoferrin receptor protein